MAQRRVQPAQRLLRFDSDTARIVKKQIDPTEAYTTLAQHVANVVARALKALPEHDRAAAQSELTNQIISLLAAHSPDAGTRDDLVEIPPEELRAILAIGNSIQSLAQVDLDLLDPAAFDVVIVDEFHHAAARTYRRLLEHLFDGDEAHSRTQPPRILLGLTATPERTDADDILHYFDNHIAVEMRLWDALERGLLCPFQYFGLHDNTDLSSVRWSRKGYDTAELERLYTGDDARVRLVLEQVRQKHRDAGTMTPIGVS